MHLHFSDNGKRKKLISDFKEDEDGGRVQKRTTKVSKPLSLKKSREKDKSADATYR